MSDSPAPASWADCATVWKAGSSLPVRYPGCAQAGAAVPVHKIACSSGQEMVTYGDHYFAVPGGTITQTTLVLRNSPVYAAAIGTCRG